MGGGGPVLTSVGVGAGGSGPMAGGSGPMAGGTGQPAGKPGASAPPSQPVGSYMTIEPGMKALFDRIEKTDQPLLLSAVISNKDPMLDQFGRLAQGRAMSWATSKDVGSDEQTRSIIDA